MPHGDFSDMAALACMAGGVQMIFSPNYQFAAVGPIQPFFDGSSPSGVMAVKLIGSLLLTLGSMLFTVRWNTINGDHRDRC